MQPNNPLNNPPNPLQPQAPPVQVPQLSWSYFKPEFSGKPEEDVVAHLLRTNDWIETHNFPDDTKVRRFCLTLTGEVRLWFETLRLIEIDWTALQECFRQQYSKFGSTREQYFHVWRSFHYDENTDTIDSLLYNILLLINQYSSSITINTMSDIRESQWSFHQIISSESLGHCISP